MLALLLSGWMTFVLGDNNSLTVQEVCQPYLQLEDKLHCGEAGYLIHYGLRNCRNFNSEATRARFSPPGRQFIDCTTTCLLGFLAKMAQDPASTCSSVSRDAFDSHTDCYIKCDFCKICKTDKKALWSTYNLRDFFTMRALKQVARVAASCGWFGFSCFVS